MKIKLKNQKKPEEEKQNDPPKKEHSPWSIIYFLVFIFLFFTAFLFYLKYVILSDNSGSNTPNYSFEVPKSQPLPEGENVERVKITQEELQKLIDENQSSFPIKDAKIKITPENIQIDGKSSNNFLALKLSVEIVPKVENGKVVFDITGIKTFGISAPKSIKERANSELNNYLSSKSDELFGHIDVKSVQLFDGYVIATGLLR